MRGKEGRKRGRKEELMKRGRNCYYSTLSFCWPSYISELPPVIHTRIQTKMASAPVTPFGFILSDVAII